MVVSQKSQQNAMVLQVGAIELSYGRFIQGGLDFVEPFRMDRVKCPLGVAVGCWLKAGCLASFVGGFVYWLIAGRLAGTGFASASAPPAA